MLFERVWKLCYVSIFIFGFNRKSCFLTLHISRPELEAVWTSITSDSPLPPNNVPLSVDNDSFPSRDAVISLPKFIKFW